VTSASLVGGKTSLAFTLKTWDPYSTVRALLELQSLGRTFRRTVCDHMHPSVATLYVAVQLQNDSTRFSVWTTRLSALFGSTCWRVGNENVFSHFRGSMSVALFIRMSACFH